MRSPIRAPFFESEICTFFCWFKKTLLHLNIFVGFFCYLTRQSVDLFLNISNHFSYHKKIRTSYLVIDPFSFTFAKEEVFNEKQLS
jgi:hypothetical protein